MIKEITDVDLIYQLWKPFTKELGIPYRDYIREQVEKHAYYGYYTEDGNLAGISTYYIYNRKKAIYIEALITFPEYRGQKISTKLISYIYKEVESLIKTLGYTFMVNAQEGLPNNDIYRHLSLSETHFSSRSGKTKLVDYVLNTDLLEQRYQQYFNEE